MIYRVLRKVTLVIASLCFLISFGLSAEAQLTTQSCGDLKITACWVTPDMDGSSLSGLSDAEKIVDGAKMSYALYYHGIEIGRSIAILAVWLDNTGDSEQVLQMSDNMALVEDGGRQDAVLITVATPSKDTKETSRKDLDDQIARVPPRSTVPLLFVCEGPSPAAESVSFDLGVVRSMGTEVFSSKISLSRGMRDLLSAYVERARGMAYAQKGEYANAIEHYDTAISLYSTNPVFLINRAAARINNDEISLGAEDCKKAIALLKSGRTTNDDYLERAYLNLGTCERRLGNSGAALEAYNDAAMANKKSALAYLEIADCQQENGRLVEARRALTSARARDPRNERLQQMDKELQTECAAKAKGLLKQAQEYLESGVTEDAVKACQSAVQLMPDDEDVLYEASSIFRSTGYNDFAIAELRKLATRDPKMSIYHSDLALVYKAKGMHKEAKAEANTASKLNGSVPTVSFYVALQYMSSGCAEFAIPELQNALKHLPNSGELHAELAMAYEESGRDKDAKAEYEKAVKLSPKSAFVHYNFAVYFHRKRDFTNALKHYELSRRYRIATAKTIDFGRGTEFPIPELSVDQLDDMIRKAKSREVVDD